MLSFEGQAVVVTGAGRGMGRTHALALAERGASVLVNDIGSSMTGDGSDPGPAAEVVAEIEAAGGMAAVNHDDVSTEEGCDAVVAACVERFGRVDAIVHNAGIYTRFPVAEMTNEIAAPVLDLHLMGAIGLTRAAWPHFASQGGGRMLYISSGAGLYGMAGSAHYGAAKTGLLALARIVSQEGAAEGIHANTLAVAAMTRMMETVFGDPPELAEWWWRYMRPELTSAAAVWLAHPDCGASGNAYHAAGGSVTRVVIGESRGYVNLELTPEDVRDHMAEIDDLGQIDVPLDVTESADILTRRITGAGAPPPPQPSSAAPGLARDH